MERGGTGFQTMIECYKNCSEEKQPGVLIYPGFLDLRLFDILYEEIIEIDMNDISDKDKVIELLKTGPKSVKDLQSATKYNSRSLFLKKIIRPLIENNYIYRDGNAKSPSTLIHLSDDAGSNRKI